MRTNYGKLQQKLKETEARCEILIAQNRRARTVGKANAVHAASTGANLSRSMQKMRMKVLGDEAGNSATRLLLDDGDPNSVSDSLDDRFRKLERDDRIESLLSEIKGRPTQAG